MKISKRWKERDLEEKVEFLRFLSLMDGINILLCFFCVFLIVVT